MNTYKYKIGDAFALKGMSVADVSLSIVVYSNTNTLVTFETQVAIKEGRTVPAFALIKYNLNSKEELDKLSDLELYPLPISKYGVSGSEVVYGEDTYILIGATQINIGYMSFIKPLLVNLNRVIEFVEEAVINGDSSYQMTKDIDLLISQNKDIVKIPLESDKNLIIYESREASMPIKKIDKIEVSSSDNNSDNYLKTPYNSDNDRMYESNISDPFSIVTGAVFFADNSIRHNFLSPISFSFLAKDNKESSNVTVILGQLFRFENSLRREGRPNYFIGDGDFMYPDWSFKIDNKIEFGSIFSNSKGNSFRFLCKMVKIQENDGYVPKFTNINSYKPTSSESLIAHPEVFQGGNVKYKENADDLFLMVVNETLAGTKKYGFNSIFDKQFGSNIFPLIKRSQLKGVLTSAKLIKQKNVNEYSKNKYILKVTYLTNEFLENLDETERASYNNVFYKELGQSNRGLKERDVIKYFDSKRLSELQESKPLVADKINELISKSIKLYLSSLTQNNNKSLNSKDGVKLKNNGFIINLFDKRNPDGTNQIFWDGLDASFKSKKDPIFRGETSTFLSIFDSINFEFSTLQFDNLNYNESVIQINEFQKFIFTWISVYKGALNKFSIEPKNNNIKINGGFQNDFEIVSNYLIPYKFNIELEVTIQNYVDFGYGEIEVLVSVKNILSVEIKIKRNEYEILEKLISVANQTNLLVQSCLDSFDVFHKLNSLIAILPILEYYNVVKEANIDDLKYDIRYRQWLSDARIFGVLTRKDISRYDQFLSSVNNFFEEMINLFPNLRISQLYLYHYINWSDWRAILGDKENKRVEEYVYDRRNEIPEYYDKLYSNNISDIYAITLLSHEYIDMLNILLDRIEATPHIGELFKGETTPSEQLLSIWGTDDSNTIETEPISIEDENSLTLSKEEEPKVVVETVDPVNVDDEIDWDSLNVDDIDILLSDDSFDDIEI